MSAPANRAKALRIEETDLAVLKIRGIWSQFGFEFHYLKITARLPDVAAR